MPYRLLPTSRDGASKALNAAHTKWTNTPEAAQRLISEDQFRRYLDLADPAAGQTGSVYFRFKKELGEAAGALAAQTPLTTALDGTRGLLRLHISHFIQTLNNAITRGVLPRETRTRFELAIDTDRVPETVTDADLLLWAQRVIDGEAARLASSPGAAPIGWPSAADVAAARDEFRAAAGPQNAAKDRTDAEQADVEKLMPEVFAAIRDIWDTVEFHVRHEPSNPSRRRRARAWGVFYATRPGEQPDPEEPGTTPTASGEPPSPDTPSVL